jgi:hypothetical protein
MPLLPEAPMTVVDLHGNRIGLNLGGLVLATDPSFVTRVGDLIEEEIIVGLLRPFAGLALERHADGDSDLSVAIRELMFDRALECVS